MSSVYKVAVAVSGNGSNLQAIIDSAIEGVQIAPVICDRPGAPAIGRAQRGGIPVEVVDRSGFTSRGGFEDEIVKRLAPYEPDLIALAGFMRVLSPSFVKHFAGRIINLHPSLLPDFPGMNAISRALKSGAESTGCTVHFVDEGVDTGPVIARAEVPIEPGDTEETLAEKIHAQEHRTYPEVISLFASGKVRLENGKAVFS